MRAQGQGWKGKIPIPQKFLVKFVLGLENTLMEGEEFGILSGILEQKGNDPKLPMGW